MRFQATRKIKGKINERADFRSATATCVHFVAVQSAL